MIKFEDFVRPITKITVGRTKPYLQNDKTTYSRMR